MAATSTAGASRTPTMPIVPLSDRIRYLPKPVRTTGSSPGVRTVAEAALPAYAQHVAQEAWNELAAGECADSSVAASALAMATCLSLERLADGTVYVVSQVDSRRAELDKLRTLEDKITKEIHTIERPKIQCFQLQRALAQSAVDEIARVASTCTCGDDYDGDYDDAGDGGGASAGARAAGAGAVAEAEPKGKRSHGDACPVALKLELFRTACSDATLRLGEQTTGAGDSGVAQRRHAAAPSSHDAAAASGAASGAAGLHRVSVHVQCSLPMACATCGAIVAPHGLDSEARGGGHASSSARVDALGAAESKHGAGVTDSLVAGVSDSKSADAAYNAVGSGRAAYVDVPPEVVAEMEELRERVAALLRENADLSSSLALSARMTPRGLVQRWTTLPAPALGWLAQLLPPSDLVEGLSLVCRRFHTALWRPELTVLAARKVLVHRVVDAAVRGVRSDCEASAVTPQLSALNEKVHVLKSTLGPQIKRLRELRRTAQDAENPWLEAAENLRVVADRHRGRTTFDARVDLADVVAAVADATMKRTLAAADDDHVQDHRARARLEVAQSDFDMLARCLVACISGEARTAPRTRAADGPGYGALGSGGPTATAATAAAVAYVECLDKLIGAAAT